MKRRGLIGACLAACAAPAVVSANVLMPVRSLIVPAGPAIWLGDAGNGDWNDPGNWFDRLVPRAGGDVVIPGSAAPVSAHQHLMLPDGMHLNSLKITGNAVQSISGGAKISEITVKHSAIPPDRNSLVWLLDSSSQYTEFVR